MDKKKAIRIITKAAELYQKNLEDQKVCFIYGVPPVIKGQLASESKLLSGLSYYEVVFLRSNFMHLTGVKLKKNGSVKSSIDFYARCISNRLSEKDFELANDGSTNQKLEVLEQMMNIKKNVQMIGDFTDLGIKLYSEKIAGNTCACIGFVADERTGLNVPNTLLNKDIRDVSSKPQQKVYAVFSKAYNDKVYTIMEKCDRKLHLDEHILPEKIKVLLGSSCFDTYYKLG